jgi:subtilisin family serine protease
MITLAQAQTVALIDTGVYPLNEDIQKQVIGLESKIDDYHGTDIACILTKFNKNIKIISLNHKNTFDGRIKSLKEAIASKVDYIVYTSSGEKESKKEKYLIDLASNLGIKIIVSSGNDKKNIDIHKVYPCVYNIENLYCIGNSENYSNFGNKVIKEDKDNDNDCIQSLRGTSQSAAIYLVNYLNKK